MNGIELGQSSSDCCGLGAGNAGTDLAEVNASLEHDKMPLSVETEHGWLTMYHGVHHTGDGPIYRVGFALLDLDDPTIVLRRCDEWAFGPHERYEREGDVDKVVFPCGWVVDAERDQILLYYGAADTSIGLATARLSEVIRHVLACPTPERRRQQGTGETI